MEEVQAATFTVPEQIMDPRTNKKLIFGKLLGTGGFAKVFEVRVNNDQGELLAVKVVSRASLAKARAKQKLISEVRIHKSLKHTNIIGFRQFLEDSENVYIVLELCENQTLLELVKRRKRLTEPEVQYYLLQVLAALRYMHSEKVIHRDLKLGNLFLNRNMEIKIGDFGLATVIENEGERKRTICGTPNYIAPEVLDDKIGHSYEVDIWSMGVIMYTLLVGKPPFQTDDVKATYRKIRANDYSFPSECELSKASMLLIRWMLNSNPSKRPTIDEVYRSDFLTQSRPPTTLPSSSLVSEPLFLSPDLVQQLSNTLATTNLGAKPNSIKSVKASTTQEQDKENVVNPNSSSPANIVTRVSDFEESKTEQDIPPTVSPSLPNPGITSRKPSSSSSSATTKTQAIQPAALQPRTINTPTPVPVPALAPVPPVVPTGNTQDSQPTLALMSYLNHLFDPASISIILPNPVRTSATQVWVGKWVDYTNKYGLGYQLTSGSVGVFFNDKSNLVLLADEKSVEYSESCRPNSAVVSYSLQSLPAVLSKKWTLLQHFKTYMQENLIKEPVRPTSAESLAIHSKQVRVTKWFRTKSAVVFRLSHGVFQLNFFDHTKLVLSAHGDVLFINKDRLPQTFHLADFEGDMITENELTKRLRYAREVLLSITSPSITGVPASPH